MVSIRIVYFQKYVKVMRHDVAKYVVGWFLWPTK